MNFLVPLIALGLSAVMGFVIIYPSVKSLPALKLEVESKKALEAQLSSKLDNLKNLTEFKSVVDENSMLVQKVLVDEPLVPQLLTQIDQIAKESGLDVTKLNYSFSENAGAPVGATAADVAKAAAAQTSYKTVDVALGTTGNFDQVVVFLQNMEKAARLINVESFRYSADQKEPFKLDVSFSLVSPYLKVESSAVTDDPVTLSLSDANFVQFINTIRELKYYDISAENINNDVVKLAEPSETTPSAEPTEEPTEEPVNAPTPVLD
jgi:Tfp pilus assembly protein PilO